MFTNSWFHELKITEVTLIPHRLALDIQLQRFLIVTLAHRLTNYFGYCSGKPGIWFTLYYGVEPKFC